MAAVELATGYVSLTVETSNVAKQVGRMFTGVEGKASSAGANMGKAMARGFEQQKPDLDALAGEVEQVQKKITAQSEQSARKQEAAARKVEIAQAKLAETTEKYGTKSSQALSAVDRLATAQQKLEAETMSAADAQRKLDQDLAKAEKALKDAAGQSEKSATEYAKGWRGVGQRIKGHLTGGVKDASDKAEGEAEKGGEEAGSSFGDAFKGAIAGLGAAGGIAGIGASIASGIGEAFGREKLGGKLAAQLALTAPESEKAGAVAGSLYSGAYGESMEDVTTAVGAVMSSVSGMRGASAEDIEALTAKAMDLSSAFDVDVTRAAQVAGQMITTGLAEDGTEAADLLTAALQGVPTAVRDDILDAADEYGPFFADMGIQGEQAMGMLVKASEQGMYGIDKTGDAVKEFSIRATDMSKATGEAYETLGMDQEAMTEALLAGGDTGADAFDKIIGGLQGIKDPVAQSQAALALFGTPLEDLSVTEIPAFIDGLASTKSSLGDVQGASERMGDSLNNNASTTLESFKRGMVTTFVDVVGGIVIPAFQGLVGGFQDLAGWIQQNEAWLRPFATGIGIVTGAVVLWNVASKILTSSLWGQAAAFMAAHWPIMAIIAVIGLLVGAVIWAYENVDWFRAMVDTAFAAIKSAISFAWERVIKPVFNAIVGFVRDVLGPIFQWIWESVISPVFGWIGDRISEVWNGIIRPIFELLTDIVNNVVGPAIEDLWNGVVKPAFDSIGSFIRDTWNNVIKPVLDAFSGFIEEHVVPGIKKGIGFIADLWAGVKRIFAAPINWVLDVVWNKGIKAAFDNVAKAVGSDARLGAAPMIPMGDAGSSKARVGSGGGNTRYQARASGGHVQKDRPYWVGELGPELVFPNRDGYVATANQSRDLTKKQAEAAAGRKPSEATVPMGGFNWDAAVGEFKRQMGIGKVLGTDQIGAGAEFAIGGLAKASQALINPLMAQARRGLAGSFGNLAGSFIGNLAGKVFGFAKQGDAMFAGGTSGAIFEGAPGGFRRPSNGPLTSYYGKRWGKMHEGIDIAGGGPTYAAWNGVVQKTGWNIGPGRSGLGILLNHGKSLWSYYGHNPEGGIQVRPGQTVKAGQHIGYQGATGNVTGTHLHFETHRGSPWRSVNPLGYLHDNGGWHMPGTYSYNGLSKPEAVLTPDESESFKRLASAAATADSATPAEHGGLDYDQLAEALDARPLRIAIDGRDVRHKILSGRNT